MWLPAIEAHPQTFLVRVPQHRKRYPEARPCGAAPFYVIPLAGRCGGARAHPWGGPGPVRGRVARGFYAIHCGVVNDAMPLA